ncbi:unnamed protein product [Symbiodinium pilosum]|uniref:CS domain-containing protein n=1 Tax=Symbiodinium pilosum TaxID=2952 RepID=A0A812KT55_SYMPI|nr:unnamed protein product [Symbiodinium pilosum]
MQSLSILHADQNGFRPASAAFGPESAALARLKAVHELDQKSILSSMEANAVRRKEQGNLAMENAEYHHAVKEYSYALSHAQDMMDFLEVEKTQPLNGYQLRALAKGVPLPGRGPVALQPFRAVVLASRALAFLRLHAYNRAAEDAELACQLEPRYLKAWIRRAAALAAANLREQAVQVLDEALRTACPTDCLREQVCKLIVNLRSLVNVEVKAPEKDLPVIFRDADTAQHKKWRKASTQPRDVGRPIAGAPAAVSRPSSLKEDWNPAPTGKWSQSEGELWLILPLPRKPKVSEVSVQIRPRHLRVLLRQPKESREQENDRFDTVLEREVLFAVKPSESTWQLEVVDGRCELQISLQKEVAELVAEAFR